MKSSGTRKSRKRVTEALDEAANIKPILAPDSASVRSVSTFPPSIAGHSEETGNSLVDALRDSLQPLDLLLLGHALIRRNFCVRPRDRALGGKAASFFPVCARSFFLDRKEAGWRMGRGGGQVFSSPGPVQTPLELIENVAPEELDIRQLREDARLNDVVIGGSGVFLALEVGRRNQLDGERHAHEDQVEVRWCIKRFGTSLPQLAGANAF